MIIQSTEETRNFAASLLAEEKVIGYLTDTFYALGANPFSTHAAREILELKGREKGKPILVCISDKEQASNLIDTSSEIFNLLAMKHWPGPLTIVAPAKPEVPDDLTQGTGTLGVRLPANEKVRNLIRSCGGQLTGTSANLSGHPPATTAQQVKSYFGDRLPLILDSGEAPTVIPSTVIDISATPKLIREGGLSKDDLTKTLQTVLGSSFQLH
jgi:L-threonylcarbamoyladenylate synthase